MKKEKKTHFVFNNQMAWIRQIEYKIFRVLCFTRISYLLSENKNKTTPEWTPLQLIWTSTDTKHFWNFSLGTLLKYVLKYHIYVSCSIFWHNLFLKKTFNFILHLLRVITCNCILFHLLKKGKSSLHLHILKRKGSWFCYTGCEKGPQ